MSESKSNARELGVASIETLESLAAEGKFLSVSHSLPRDWNTAEWKFTCNGVEQPSLNLVEVFAPGTDYGWAVAYVVEANGDHLGRTTLIRGHWTIERLNHNTQRTPETDDERSQEYIDRADQLSEAPIG